MHIITSTDILLPRAEDMSAWSVIACDQFTAEPDYWAAAEKLAAEKPSTLSLMLPEAWLHTARAEGADRRIADTMRRYLAEGVFQTIPDSFIYVERILPDGRVRRGLVAALDLEQYDFTGTQHASVRSTEGTVEERLPPRVRIRRGAPLEMPHTLLLMDDRTDSVLSLAEKAKTTLEKVYDFDLMLGGGHITGWRVSGETKAAVQAALDALDNAALQRGKYGDAAENGRLTFAVGDGNHSLAAAKRFWEEKREMLPPNERQTDPARFALVEVENIHEPSLDFEPIHRVLFDTDTSDFARSLAAHRAEWEAKDKTLGERVAAAESFCRAYIAGHGGTIDYIHGDDTARSLGEKPNCAAVLLPPVEKNGLFLSVLKNGALPKKSFSMGNARDKRYYLECRKIL